MRPGMASLRSRGVLAFPPWRSSYICLPSPSWLPVSPCVYLTVPGPRFPRYPNWKETKSRLRWSKTNWTRRRGRGLRKLRGPEMQVGIQAGRKPLLRWHTTKLSKGIEEESSAKIATEALQRRRITLVHVEPNDW